MGSCCCAEKPKKEEGTHAQLQEDKTQATERQDVQQSAEQQQKLSDEAVAQHEHPSREKGTSSEEKPKQLEDEQLLVPNQSNEMKKQPPEVKSAEPFKSKEVEGLEMKKGGAAHARKKKSAKGNKDHKDNSASDPIDYWLTAEERKKVASGEPILPVDKTMEVVLSVVQPPPVDYSALPPGLKPTALHASDEKTQLPESPKPGNVQKASGESANKSDGAAADHQRRLSSKETKRSTQGPLRSREKVSSKVPVIEGAYGVADRPLTPPSAPQAYGVADRPMGFRSAERTSTHKRPVMEGAYGVADRPKSSAPAVQAYGVVDRPVAQPSAKQMHGGFFDVVRQQQLAHAHANRGMAGGAPRAPSLSQPVRIQTQGGGAK